MRGYAVIKLAAAALGGLGLVASTVESLAHVNEQFAVNFWPLLLVSWVLAVAALWPAPERPSIGFHTAPRPHGLQRLQPYGSVIAVTCVALLAGVWFVRHQQFPAVIAGSNPIVNVDTPVAAPPHIAGDISPVPQATPMADLGVVPANLAPAHLLAFALNTARTSYKEVPEGYCYAEFRESDSLPPGGCGPRYFKLEGFTVVNPPRQYRGYKFKPRACPAAQHPRLLEALKAFAIARKRNNVLPTLASVVVLQNAVDKRAAVLREVIPAGAEWNDIHSVADREAISTWLRECVGLLSPVFSITIKNTGTTALQLLGVQYSYIKRYAEAGGTDEASTVSRPVAQYIHVIPAWRYKNAEDRVPYDPVAPEVKDSLIKSQTLFALDDAARLAAYHITTQRPFTRALKPVLSDPNGFVNSLFLMRADRCLRLQSLQCSNA